jgi:ADP-heptose:LPS heptosyltransferase
MFLKKYWYKITNKQKHQDLKNIERAEESRKVFQKQFEPYIDSIQKKINSKKNLSFLHSGHVGDVINALPVIKELSKNHDCVLYIGVDKSINVNYNKHPAKKVFINKKLYKMLEPLLASQKYIKKVEEYNAQEIDINFDIFRELPINISFDNLRYSFQLTGIQPNIEDPYLEVSPHQKIQNKIIVQRTFRYRNQFINYKFLNKFDNIYFLGTLEEFEDLKKDVPKLNFYDCKDFLEMAQIIKSCRFFIANSSMAFPIAEALKVPRLLEACPYFPAAQPHGKNAYDFYYQIHFEKFFDFLNNNNKE